MAGIMPLIQYLQPKLTNEKKLTGYCPLYFQF